MLAWGIEVWEDHFQFVLEDVNCFCCPDYACSYSTTVWPGHRRALTKISEQKSKSPEHSYSLPLRLQEHQTHLSTFSPCALVRIRILDLVQGELFIGVQAFDRWQTMEREGSMVIIRVLILKKISIIILVKKGQCYFLSTTYISCVSLGNKVIVKSMSAHVNRLLGRDNETKRTM